MTMENGWFNEVSETMLPGQKFGLQAEEVLFQEKSKYQDILVFKSKTYGNVLVLDGMINCTERDEFSYQEMISFLPLNSHPHPRNVLLVGGGDGGVARECAKHPLVENIHMVEIDQVVIDACRKFLPGMAVGMDHPKVSLFVQDGLEFLKNNSHKYDVIIADLSDPEGPAEQLFQQEFYKEMKKSLNCDGILCTQGEIPWIDLPIIKRILTFCRDMYPSVTYATSNVPTYPCGCMGYVICSLEEGKKFGKPLHVFSDKEKDQMHLRFYNEQMHTAAFSLPQYLKKELQL